MSTSSVGRCLRGCVFASVVLASACASSPKGSGGSAGGGGAGAFGGNDGGAGTSNGASQTVGTQGGTITLDGVTLTIPGDALPGDTVVTVSTTTAPAGYLIASAAYQLAPADTTFVPAVSVTLPLTMTAPRAHLFLSNGSGGFEDRGGIVSGPIITAQVTHFGTCFAATPSSDGGALDLAGDVAGAHDGGDAASGTDANGKDGAGAAGSGAASAGSAGGGGAGSGAAGAGAAGSGAAGAGTAGAAGSGGQTDAGQASDTGGASDAGASPDSGDGGTDAASSPLCDATGINAPVVSVTTISDGTPVPEGSTYTGGTISSGTYYLTSVTHYGTDYTGPQKSVHTFDATAQTLRAIDSPFLQGTVSYTGFNLSNTDAHTLQGVVVCSTAQVSTTTWYYTIPGSTMTMSEVGSSDVAVYSTGP